MSLREWVLRGLLPAMCCSGCGSRAGTGLILTQWAVYPQLNGVGIQTTCQMCGGFGSGVFEVPDWVARWSSREKPQSDPIGDDELLDAKLALREPDWWSKVTSGA